MFQNSGVESPASGFWSPLTVASRLLHLHSIEEKTPRLMLKLLSTARNTQRDSQLCKEGKREEEDRIDQEEKRKNQKRREKSIP